MADYATTDPALLTERLTAAPDGQTGPCATCGFRVTLVDGLCSDCTDIGLTPPPAKSLAGIIMAAEWAAFPEAEPAARWENTGGHVMNVVTHDGIAIGSFGTDGVDEHGALFIGHDGLDTVDYAEADIAIDDALATIAAVRNLTSWDPTAPAPAIGDGPERAHHLAQAESIATAAYEEVDLDLPVGDPVEGTVLVHLNVRVPADVAAKGAQHAGWWADALVDALRIPRHFVADVDVL